jgi:hypothetical protein
MNAPVRHRLVESGKQYESFSTRQLFGTNSHEQIIQRRLIGGKHQRKRLRRDDALKAEVNDHQFFVGVKECQR